MIVTFREQERLPWGAVLTGFACTVHGAAILIYAAVLIGLLNTELSWQGVEQVPRWFMAAFAVGVMATHGTVAIEPLLPPGWRRSPPVRLIRTAVAVACVLSLLFVALLLPFAAIEGAEWEGWVLMGCLGVSAAIVLVSEWEVKVER